MQTEIKLLTPKEIASNLGIPISKVYNILHIKGCPLVLGKKKGEHFLVEQTAFEMFLRRSD